MARLLVFPFVLLFVVTVMACGGDDDEEGGYSTDYPSAGEDVFESTTATVEIEYAIEAVSGNPVAGGRETIEVEGPTRVTRSDPADQDGDGLAEVKTEVVEMELHGTASFGEVIITEREDKESVGLVEQQEQGQDFPADSYFEMFVQVELPPATSSAKPFREAGGLVAGEPNTVLAITEGPMRMEATLSDLPPGEGDRYESADGQEVPLVAVNDATLRLGSIVDALHIPNPEGGDEPTEEPTDEPTDEPEDTAAPTSPGGGAPTAEVQQQVGCEHTQPGVQSDIVDLIFAYLIEGPASSTTEGRETYVLQLVSGDGTVLYGPSSKQEGEPLEGATVSAMLYGAGALQPKQSGETDAEGAARLRFPINKFGSYEVIVESVTGADGTVYEFSPDSLLSGRYTVGEVCEQPPGF